MNPTRQTKKVGECWFLSYRTEIFVAQETDGSPGATSCFRYPRDPEHPYARIEIDITNTNWWRIVSTILHEMYEYTMTQLRCAYSVEGDLNESSDGRVFLMTHAELSEVGDQVANSFESFYSEVHAAWVEAHKPKRKKKRTNK